MSVYIFPQDTIVFLLLSRLFFKRQKRIFRGPMCSDFKNNFFVASYSTDRISFLGRLEMLESGCIMKTK